MTAQARKGTSGNGALSINQDHRTRELWREVSEQLPDDRRGEEEKVENTKLNCKTSVLIQQLRRVRMLTSDPGKLAHNDEEMDSARLWHRCL